ncbi:MAG: hypothetical protein M5U26_24020 [Planctomycetota bacterium]|nr:hypothetical protein [Planctomycetota bacterium]
MKSKLGEEVQLTHSAATDMRTYGISNAQLVRIAELLATDADYVKDEYLDERRGVRERVMRVDELRNLCIAYMHDDAGLLLVLRCYWDRPS